MACVLQRPRSNSAMEENTRDQARGGGACVDARAKSHESNSAACNVSQQMGHRDASITLRVYAHYLPDASLREVDRLDALQLFATHS